MSGCLHIWSSVLLSKLFLRSRLSFARYANWMKMEMRAAWGFSRYFLSLCHAICATRGTLKWIRARKRRSTCLLQFPSNYSHTTSISGGLLISYSNGGALIRHPRFLTSDGATESGGPVILLATLIRRLPGTRNDLHTNHFVQSSTNSKHAVFFVQFEAWLIKS
jgi:hypothetical protein